MRSHYFYNYMDSSCSNGVTVTDVSLEGVAVGFIPGKYRNENRYRDLVDVTGIDGTVFDGHEEFLAGLDDNLRDIEYLVLEAGPAELEILAAVRESTADVALLYVSDDAERAKAAMTSGASVFLANRNVEKLEARLESLHVGSIIDTGWVEADASADGLGDVHYLAYETLMERFEDLIYVFDRHGRFLKVNDSKAAFHRQDPDEFVGKSDFDHFEAETALEVYQDTIEVMEGNRTVDNKAEWIERYDGEIVHVTASKHPIENEDGVVIGQIGVSRDITTLTKQKMKMRNTKELINHLYRTFDHNFRNRSQASLGMTTLTEGQHPASVLDTTLTSLDRTIDELGETLSDAEDGVDADLSVEDGASSVTGHSLTAFEDELNDLCDTARSALDEVVMSIDEAQAHGRNKAAKMDRLIADFSELVSVVNTSGQVNEIDVGRKARRSLDLRVEVEDEVSVEADSHNVAMLFEQLARETRQEGQVTIRSSDVGFEIDAPGRIEVPAMGDRFRIQHLNEKSKPMLKLRLLAKAEGWEVKTRYPVDGRTVIRFDVNAWKRQLSS